MILCVYKEGLKRTEPTLKLLLKYNATIIIARNSNTYETALKAEWGQDDIIIIEHDILFKKKHLQEISTCDHFLCAFNYYLYPPTTELDHPELAHRSWDIATGRLIWNNKGHITADRAGFGMTKISKEFQKKHKPDWEKGEWNNLDTRFSIWINEKLGYKFNIHQDVVYHNHC